ncbi:US3 protein [Gallid alphaherpesvirus 3]|uniref:US3 protein n=2 Tax=Gallid alphaherpesvirus 3 TaxID=35250 RepID=F8TC87_9ALPH|nr:US3 protein [Gallid alphaherpesvirus 3]AEI00298.1 US3 protein [Gallid alphaherpesvirus 3]QEY02246.1 US3 protein [Gallid alphaherpesvirus 3]
METNELSSKVSDYNANRPYETIRSDTSDTDPSVSCGTLSDKDGDDEESIDLSKVPNATNVGAGEDCTSPNDGRTELCRTTSVTGPASVVRMQYNIISPLPPSSEGRVFVCTRWDDVSNKKVIVKVVTGGRDPGREIEIVKTLSHCAIIQLIHAYSWKSTVCMVMPKYKCDLFTYVDRKESIPLKDVIVIERRLLEALVYLHGKGVIHRDVKTENIFLDYPGNAVLGDFGAACKLDMHDNSPKCYGWAGTMETNSPELLALDPYCAKTDIWSAGLVLFEMSAKKRTLFGKQVKTSSSQLRALIRCLQIHALEFPQDESTTLCKQFKQYAIPLRPPFSIPEVVRRNIPSMDVEYTIAKMLTFDQEFRPSAQDILAFPLFVKEAPQNLQALFVP